MPGTALASLVRARREQLHLTQNDLARRIGVSRSEISELEAGRVRHPRAGVLARLGKVLGVPAAALLAAVGYVASEALGAPGAVEVEDAEELLVLGSLLSQLPAGDRRWLRDRLRELQELVLLRRRGGGLHKSAGTTRAPQRGQRRV